MTLRHELVGPRVVERTDDGQVSIRPATAAEEARAHLVAMLMRVVTEPGLLPAMIDVADQPEHYGLDRNRFDPLAWDFVLDVLYWARAQVGHDLGCGQPGERWGILLAWPPQPHTSA